LVDIGGTDGGAMPAPQHTACHRTVKEDAP